jgi:hypothetical protein
MSITEWYMLSTAVGRAVRGLSDDARLFDVEQHVAQQLKWDSVQLSSYTPLVKVISRSRPSRIAAWDWLQC